MFFLNIKVMQISTLMFLAVSTTQNCRVKGWCTVHHNHTSGFQAKIKISTRRWIKIKMSTLDTRVTRYSKSDPNLIKKGLKNLIRDVLFIDKNLLTCHNGNDYHELINFYRNALKGLSNSTIQMISENNQNVGYTYVLRLSEFTDAHTEF